MNADGDATAGDGPAHEPTLEDRIFPPGPPRDGHIARTALVGSWESQFIGIGRLTSFVSSRLLDQSHAVDDLSLSVMYLQRHRVEVGLKLLLERAGEQIPLRHDIKILLDACADACTTVGLSDAWRTFAVSQQDYIGLMHGADPSSTAFRYPVGTSRRASYRRELIDIEELEKAGGRFEGSLLVLVRGLAWLEPLPIGVDQHEVVATELRELIRTCRDVVRTRQRLMNRLRAENDRAFWRSRRRRREGAEDWAAAALDDVTTALADRAESMLERLASTGEPTSPPSAETMSRSDIPRLDLSRPQASWPAQIRAQERWMVDEQMASMRPLMRAVAAVQRRSVGWSTPAARQLHLDVARFNARLSRAEAEKSS